jgi:hypothetical protein
VLEHLSKKFVTTPQFVGFGGSSMKLFDDEDDDYDDGDGDVVVVIVVIVVKLNFLPWNLILRNLWYVKFKIC